MNTLILLIALLIAGPKEAASKSIDTEGEPEEANSIVHHLILENFHYHASHTPAEWNQLFGCHKNLTPSWPLTNLWARVLEPECRRDEHSWRFRYVDEFRTPGAIYVKDADIDERFANIIKVLSLHNMFDLSFSFFNSGDAKMDALNEIAVAGAEVDDVKCTRDMNYMMSVFYDLREHLKQRRAGNSTTRLEPVHIQLAQVLDSYGRYESGSLDGKLRLVGAYDQCESGRLSSRHDGELMRMRYCVANLNIDRDLEPTLRERKRYAHESSPGQLATAVCLPRSCHSRTLHTAELKQHVQHLVDSQMQLPNSIYVHQTYQVDSVFCLADRDSEYMRLSLSGKLCLLFVTGWTLLAVTFTLINQYSLQDEKAKPRDRNSFINRFRQYFDLAQSWHDLYADKRPVDPNEPIDLDNLNPIKLFCCFWCIMCHMTFLLGSISAGQGRIAAFVDLDPGFQVALLTSTIIDTFYTISGMLITFVTLTKLHKRSERQRHPTTQRQASASALNTSFIGLGECDSLTSSQIIVTEGLANNNVSHDNAKCNGTSDVAVQRRSRSTEGLASFIGQWFVLAANRYLRIVPLYAILFWFRRDVFTYLGSGPLWDHGLNKETPNGACAHESWWIPFTFWSAFLPMAKQCYIPSWSISLDILFGLLIPPILILYIKRPRLAVASALLLALVNVLISIEATFGAEPGLIWELLEARMVGVVLMFTGLSHLYTWPFVRAPAYLIGSIAGYYLFRYNLAHQRQQRNQLNANKTNGRTSLTPDIQSKSLSLWPSWFRGLAVHLCWFYLFVHLVVSIFSVQLRHVVAPYHRFVSAYWLSADRGVWALAFATIFLRLVTDWRHKPVVRHFASQRWRTLSKMNFSIMFIHWMVILVFLGLMPTTANFTLWQISAAVTVVTVASIPIAALVYVIFENPIDKIVKNELFRF